MTSTPSSGGSPAPSPANIAPAPQLLAIKPTPTLKMASIAPNAVVPVKTLGPHREWVLPPRPKPGRKPATDTPPTKRKAQNRAAQRAFRERRAARVGELEEQLKETEEQRQRREQEMRDQIDGQNAEILRLEAEVKRFSDETKAWHDRYIELEKVTNTERRDKEAALVELSYLRYGARSVGTDAVPLPPRRQPKATIKDAPARMDVSSVTEPLGCGSCSSVGDCACTQTALEITVAGCGKCSHGNDCECLEESLRSLPNESSELKRSLSPDQTSHDKKRPKHSLEQPGPLEVDFTSMFSSKPSSLQSRPSQETVMAYNASLRAGGDSCGFCDGNTFCLCAEAAAAQSANPTLERENEIRLAPLLHEVTPPPSETDVTISDTPSMKLPSLHPNHRMHHAVKPPTLAPIEDSCARGPGSCRQCQEDPKSGLFCRSLAAMRSSGSPVDSGCCGGAGSGGGCCKSTELSLPAATEPSLSCAETYKTLASHRNFDQASDELGNWLPKLHAVAPKYPGRGPVDIEAASVMNVIKYFDVRFGRD